MRILITGIDGSIAPHVANHFVREGHVVMGSSHHEKSVVPANVSSYHCDVSNFESVKKLLNETTPDAIVHLAAVSVIGRSWTNPAETMNVNLQGTIHFLETLRQTNSKCRFIFMGSREVYGNVPPEKMPITESVPLAPVNPYGVSKAGGEWMVQLYATKYGVDALTIRAFNHTAPDWPERFVDSNWCKQVARMELGKQPPVLEVGDLSSVRDYLDCRDAARAIDALIQKGRKGEAYNVCSGKPTSGKMIIDELLSRTTKPFEVKVDPARIFKDQVKEAWGSNQKIREHTGWSPKYDSSQTQLELLSYWRKIEGSS